MKKLWLFVLLINTSLLVGGAALAQSPAGKEYTVQAGDELGKLAEKEYGNPLAYPVIVDATNAKSTEDDSFTAITDPNMIEIGQKLWLPAPAESSNETASSAPVDDNSHLTVRQLKNATYSGIYDEPVTLTDGKYKGEPFVEGGASHPSVWYIDNAEAYGDLDADGVADTAVLLVENSGGSGVFSYVGVQLNRAGQPVDAGTVWVGDRTQIKTMIIEAGQVVLEIVTQGPNDPQCCATQKMRKSYALQDGKPAEVGSEELGTVSLDDLTGTRWVLESFDGDQPVLAESTITAEFAAGQVTGLSGCNSYNATTSSDGGQNLTVGPAISTQVACEQPVMDQELAYLTALQSANQWGYLPDKLVMTYDLEDGLMGRMTFSAAPVTQAETMPPAEEMASGEEIASDEMAMEATKVITFLPTAIPADKKEGACFANAIGLGREDAWRCSVGNEIFDPCFAVGDAPTVICGANPATGDIGFELVLTEPLPAPETGALSMAWMVELADGQVCGLMTGTVPGVGERTAPYGCPDGSNLFGDFQQGEVWLAEKAIIGLNSDGFFIEQSEMVPISRVWQ